MKRLTALLRNRLWETGFGLALLLVFAYIAARHAGTYPSVFADEQIYSHFARLVRLEDVTIPSYLYLSAYGLTNACGDAFLSCARYLNLLFFVGSAPFIYLATRTVAPKPVAMLAAVLCVAAPTSTYTGYFMPESMYFFGFAVLTWLALAQDRMHWAARATAAGAVLGLMTLVKVHALFLAPSLALFMAWLGWNHSRDGAGLGRGVAAAVLSVAAVFAAKFIAGFLFVGKDGLQVLGSFYGNQASEGVSAGATLLTLLPAAWFSLQGHLMSLVLLFALPLAALAWHGASRNARAAAGPQASALMVYTVLMLGAALALTVFYTASTASFGPFDGKRLHARYYTFALILPVMIAAAHSAGSWRPSRAALPWVLAALLAAAIVYASAALPASYLFLVADGPEIVALGLGKPGSMATMVLAVEIAVLALWAMSRRLGSLAFLLVFMPLYIVNGEMTFSTWMSQYRQANAYDNAGRYAREHLTQEQRNGVRIAGDNLGELLRARFHVDAPQADTMVLPAGWEIAPYSLPGRKSWLLVVGDYKLPAGVATVFKNAQFALVAAPSNNRALGEAKLSAPFGNGLLAGADGLAGPEGWGRWSNDDQVRLHFAQPLPKRLNLFLTMQAFGPNVGKDFVVRVGGAEQRVKLAPLRHEIFLQFDTDGLQKTVTIDVPQAVSPKELGWSGDTRRIGLGLERVEIGTPAD
ncbi:DUF7024 domain-containing protein [Massilia sp. GCM10020059]|uniref:DUF7024 domain-containing protein n=1 Tax=Massilia agrisoli TaxID=2892444 RepID=A0ABS8J0L0_9BURK|nr:hypothetical protein [Massilia agrisoli]MCC6073453.1 hypothetical protein [Massilia agrisoli]